MQRYNGSLARALVELYPDINLDPYQFYTSKVQRKSLSPPHSFCSLLIFLKIESQWTKKEKVKLFFDTMAQKHGFDPARSMDQWYALKRIDFASEPVREGERERGKRGERGEGRGEGKPKLTIIYKGGSTIMNHFKGSLNAALASVYPNLKARRITGMYG